MLNANDTQLNLEKWFQENCNFWMKNKQGDSCFGNERESFRRALEWDLIEIYNFNGGCLHEYGVPNGDVLDTETCINFFKTKCMDMYGKDWEAKWKEYNIRIANK